jgi:3-hydroxyacyl-CoA dehydrogenase/enoyl-CoA hydratase/3-hydroxybutyryl-CoA epimerase/enoyl-CoA isomerase
MQEAFMYSGQSVRVSRSDDHIAELWFDRTSDTINELDMRTVEELRAATAAMRSAPDLRCVLVRSAKPVFIVGADIFEFTQRFAEPEPALAAAFAEQNAVFTAFKDQ